MSGLYSERGAPILIAHLDIVVAVGAILAVIISISYIVGIYNGLIHVRQNAEKAWSNIDVLLKQRHDELPKLIAVCEGYKAFERQTLETVVRARSQYGAAASEQDRVRSAGQLSGAVRGLLALAERYPDLKASQNFLQLQQRISALEDQIADRREFYNDSVNIFNIRIQELPDVFIANLLGLQPRTLYAVSKAEAADVPISFK